MPSDKAPVVGLYSLSGVPMVEFVANHPETGGGFGSCNPDHEFFGYRQSI